ncbi:histidine--tRNA ligase [Granulosicoccus sp.]|nr:histidine--tRNA ligase [Granulosicoccus sp.]
MKTQFTRLRGMADQLPTTVAPWQHLEQAVRDVMRAYGYGEMRTPLIERTSLFKRSIGEATDIVEKEMYTFADRNDELLTLRPENTAGCVRAAIENGMLQPGSVSRIWYTGPMFRYERPQLGRQRQFFQTGAEVYGLAGPEIEAELILLSARLWRELSILDSVQLEVNTLGDPADRAAYRDKLVNYFKTCESQLDDDSVRRLERNPLRILDSKNPDMQEIIAGAPALRDSLSDASLEHFEQLLRLLETAGITPIENPRLVRGLDYYSHTVFEWTTDKLGSQSAVCAGGRYDGLLEQMGAKNMPGVGWAFGMERVIALLDTLELNPVSAVPDVFVMASNEVSAADSLALAEYVRQLMPACSVLHNTGAGSMKSQFKKADKSGAAVAIVIGSEEIEKATVTLKPLLSRTEQVSVPRNELQQQLQTLLAV